MADQTVLGSLLSDLSERHGVPGAVLGIRDSHRSLEVATGVADVRTDLPVTTDTRFLIGSISKAYTATIAMQLVDEGRIELDAPVREYLPELRLKDSRAAAVITTRQLLSHTSGIDDPPEEALAAEISLERFVATLESAAQRHGPGGEFSYSNAGYAIVGRLVEVVTGSPFPEAVLTRVVEPLGLDGTFCTGTVRHPPAGNVAVGHEAPEGGLPRAVAAWSEGLSSIGGICTTIRDLMLFVRTHLKGGVTDHGDRLLSEEAVATMLRPQVEATGLFEGDFWGLGWWLSGREGLRIFGHYGWRSGQTCVLHAFPEQTAAVAVLTNADSGIRLYQEVLTAIERQL